jgi:hypothetical protein
MMVVQPGIAQQGVFQVLPTDEVMAAQDLLDAAIEALDHAVRLRASSRVSRCSAPRLAKLVELMVAAASMLRAKQAIGKLLAIVASPKHAGESGYFLRHVFGEHLLDAYGASLGQRGEELARRARRRP